MLLSGELRWHRRAARAALAVVMVIALSSGAIGTVGAQGSQEWWDLHEAAKKIIENDKSTESQLEGARRSLLQALKAKDSEGNFETYNPSVRIDYLPHFYLGWANMRLKRYDEAARNFRRSEEIGFIKKSAPAQLRSKFDGYQSLVAQLKPAADALGAARSNTLVSQCAAAAPKVRDAMSKIEAFLAAPSDPSALKGWMDALSGAQSECAREVGGRILAAALDDFNKARDAVAVEGLSDLLSPDTQREFDSAIAAGKEAESKGDDKGLKAAADKLRGLPPKVARDVDARLASLAQEADKIARGNQQALDRQNQMGTRLTALAGDARNQRAAGKTGKDLSAVVKVGSDLKSLLESARSAIAPLLLAQGSALDSARRDHDSWAGTHACEVGAVGLKDSADAAVREAAAARQGESADAMESAAARLSAIRRDVESRMKDALPRKQEEARGAITGADSLLANVTDADQKRNGESLKGAIQQALAKNDVCAIDESIVALNRWVARVSPALEADRNRAIARNRPALDEGQRLLVSYGGILRPETATALKGPVERLAGLVRNSYDVAAIDRTGQEVASLVTKASGELNSQIQEGVRALRGMRSDPRWADVSPARRQWLEQNLPAMERPSPDAALIARFAVEYPRARVEMALSAAFGALYDQEDAGRAAKTIEDLGPGLRSGSAALSYALSYFYWLQVQEATGSERDALMARAREAFVAGKARGMDLASMGAVLFAPAFVEEMSRLQPSGG